MQPLTLVGPIDVNRRLAELGLHWDGIREAILAGDLARQGCTPNDPPTAPGYLFWARTLRGLGDAFSPHWHRDDADNFPVLLNAEGVIAVAVSTGDQGTGNPTAPANMKYPRGPRGQAAIRANAQSRMFAEYFTDVDAAPERETWFLLVSRREDQIHSELSLPGGGVDSSGRVEDWAERIMLPTITPSEPRSREDDSEGDAGDIDIDVRRKG